MRLNGAEQRSLVEFLVDDMLGLGPLEPLIADETITDIMVNGPYQVYVEQGGKLRLTDVKFRDNQHVLNICTRIVTKVSTNRRRSATPGCWTARVSISSSRRWRSTVRRSPFESSPSRRSLSTR